MEGNVNEGEMYRRVLGPKEQRKLAAELERQLGEKYHVRGKKKEGYVIGEEGVTVLNLGSNYVRVEGRGALQDRLRAICEDTLKGS